ncbi:MAG: hypothetical protein MUF52_01105 [Syntrophobacteraceae bacterium]|jgi:hypothetical protein|nr:hypothetical protein [Syntrophobacteraceae bacterium]
MDEKVVRELEVLRGMLNNWKDSFMSWAEPDGDNEHVLLELREEIQTNLYPYVRRLYETNHLTSSEATEFMVYCLGQVEVLRVQLSGVETGNS